MGNINNMEDNIFDKIYALRISLMDIYYDERAIIFNIKKNLHKYDNISTDEELNNIIIDFYKRYDIDITTINLEELKVVIPPNSYQSNIDNLDNLINNYNQEISDLENFMNLLNNITNSHQEDSNDLEEQQETDSDDLDEQEEDLDEEEEEDLEQEQEEEDLEQEQEQDLEQEQEQEEDNTITSEYNNLPSITSNITDNYPYVSNNPQISNTLNSLNNLITQMSNNSTNNNNNFYFSTQLPVDSISPTSFLNVIDVFNQALNNNYYQENEYQDVIVTLDDNDYDSLKQVKYSE